MKTKNFFFVCVDNFGFQVPLKRLWSCFAGTFCRRTFTEKLSIVNLLKVRKFQDHINSQKKKNRKICKVMESTPSPNRINGVLLLRCIKRNLFLII